MKFRKDLLDKMRQDGYILVPPEPQEEESKGPGKVNSSANLFLTASKSMYATGKVGSPKKNLVSNQSSMKSHSPRYRKDMLEQQEQIRLLNEKIAELESKLASVGVVSQESSPARETLQVPRASTFR